MAKRLDIAQSTLSHFETQRTMVSGEVLRKLASEFDVSIDWLITGEGNPSRSATLRMGIPLVPEAAEAGYVASGSSNAFVSSLDRYRIPRFEGYEGLLIFAARGDSMYPTMRDGDLVVTEILDDPTQIEEDSLAVVLVRDRIFVKRLSYLSSDDGSFILKSDNPNYKAEIVPASDVSEIRVVIARVTWSVERSLTMTSERVFKLESDLALLQDELSDLRDVITRD